MKMIEKFAAAVDAAIILDRDGDVAVHARHYAGGVKQVRHKPDNGDFRPAAEWELKIAAGTAQEWVA